MKMIKILALLAGLSLIGTAEAHFDAYYRDYHGHGGRVNAEQREQHRRIERGLAKGLLTPYEYDQLARQQNRIERVERRFKRDGRLDWRERQILKQKLARASEDIRFYKYNANDYRDPRAYGYD
ncbi:hypothetical protein [Methylomicrobium sp. Wu6]|uniref:hypothetical protein n=1 Tax=Methylomicrobium sp. Wu6 TaxID=3107928 RepID=UPI002DD6A140|nr:hypothetical protein [Methylomicrobium sp. Wu6]MEC4748650.1 hypothetical protein [Methylomicrobium sp. Wu6]